MELHLSIWYVWVQLHLLISSGFSLPLCRKSITLHGLFTILSIHCLSETPIVYLKPSTFLLWMLMMCQCHTATQKCGWWYLYTEKKKEQFKPICFYSLMCYLDLYNKLLLFTFLVIISSNSFILVVYLKDIFGLIKYIT